MYRPTCVVHGGAGSWQVSAQEKALEGCRAAVHAGWHVLQSGGDALTAVVEAVVVLENNPVFNAGVGSVLTEDGTVEMDASVMNGRELAAGAVALIRSVRNPVRLAFEVAKAGREVLLAGEAAERWARTLGLETVSEEELIQAARDRQGAPPAGVGTVGAVASDAYGNVAAATSTGGRKGKRVGRVGDSPIIGAGTYADNRGGAASATGEGEAILRFGLARYAVLQLERGVSPAIVAQMALTEFSRRLRGDAGLILVDRFGRFGVAHNTPAMPVAWMTSGCARPEAMVCWGSTGLEAKGVVGPTTG
ncbi:Isoaspartyl peptidase [bacterium HR30]|nr:Isoaspartyl peptidase [bacterium HR30]